MKIAVASADGQALSPHFGRSRCFVVFTVEDGRVLDRQVRDNTFTAHARGRCAEGEAHPHDQPHSHAEVVAALRDCQVVLCGGMGLRAGRELQSNGIRPVIVSAGSVEEALVAFVAGKAASGPFCPRHE